MKTNAELLSELREADRLISKLSPLFFDDGLAGYIPCGLKEEVSDWIRQIHPRNQGDCPPSFSAIEAMTIARFFARLEHQMNIARQEGRTRDEMEMARLAGRLSFAIFDISISDERVPMARPAKERSELVA